MSAKLSLLLTGLVTAALVAASLVSYKMSATQLSAASEDRLALISTARARDLTAWIDSVEADVNAIASAPATPKHIADFARTYEELGAMRGSTLRSLYIDNNPYAVGKKHELDAAEDGSAYSATHADVHPSYRARLNSQGYYDIFLINPEGDIVYSVFKELDYATNLITGTYSESGLGRAFRRALDAGAGTLVFEDFSAYAPSANAPAAFITTAVADASGTVVGAIAFQLPTDSMQDILSARQGLTDTTKIAVVGEDMLSRTAETLSPQNGMLRPVPSNEAITTALRGQAGVADVTTQDGGSYLMAYNPITVFGTTWALLAAEPEATVTAGARQLLNQLILMTLAMIAMTAVIAMFSGRSLGAPLREMEGVVAKIAEGDYGTPVSVTGRQDEIGMIAERVETFRQDLHANEAAAKENLYKSSALRDTSAAMMITDRDFNIILTNDKVMDLLRANVDVFRERLPDFDPEVVHGACMDIFHKDPRHARAILEDLNNLPYTADITIGQKRFALYVTAVRDSNEAHLGYVVEWKDVSKERLNEAILQALNTYQCTAQVLPDGRMTEMNPAMLKAAGYAEDDKSLLGSSLEDVFVFDPEMAKKHGEVWPRLRSGESVYGRFKLNRADGDHSILEGGFSPVRDKRGTLVLVAFIGADRTEAERAMKKAEDEREAMQRQQALVVDQLRIGLDRVAKGDLVAEIDTPFQDEYEPLRQDFNGSVLSLLQTIQAVAEVALSMTSGVDSISEAAGDLSRRTEQQAATLEETAAALDELTASVRQAADGALDADRIVIEARQNAKASGEIVEEAVQAMGKIDNSSQQISKIIGVIDDIAFQTNLLALNAGVEAARAGDAGRGFAVVASEVRALAQRSSEAAREIGTLISESTGHVQTGVRLVDRTGKALAQIVEAVGNISEHVSQIASSAQEQSTGLAEINAAVNQLDQATQQNAAMYEETSAASEALSREAQSLTSSVSRFNLGTGTAPKAPSATPKAETHANNPVKQASAGGDVTIADTQGWEDF